MYLRNLQTKFNFPAITLYKLTVYIWTSICCQIPLLQSFNISIFMHFFLIFLIQTFHLRNTPGWSKTLHIPVMVGLKLGSVKKGGKFLINSHQLDAYL